MRVIYQPNQVRRAAKFLKKRNPVFERTTRDIEQGIMATLRDYVRKVEKCVKAGDDWYFTASGGYWIICYRIDDHALQVEVLISASVGRKADHIYLEG